ncbi:MAG: hypothetical protein ACYC0X_34425 [Pirellulaceae bacterium]
MVLRTLAVLAALTVVVNGSFFAQQNASATVGNHYAIQKTVDPPAGNAIRTVSTKKGEVLSSACNDRAVDVVIGESQFFNADYIKIKSVESTARGFEIGATVTVKGTYTLNSVDTADLCFNSTTTLKLGEKQKATPIQDSQRIKARKGKHRFSLSKVIADDGNPHLTFYHSKTGKPFGGVYFGDESNVLMKKGWSYDFPKPVDAQESPVLSEPN